MCVLSIVGDYWKQNKTYIQPWITPPVPPTARPFNAPLGPTRQEFEALKKEIKELKKLLLAAKAYDEATGQPDCEVDEKVEFIKKAAELVGIDLSEVFGNA